MNKQEAIEKIKEEWFSGVVTSLQTITDIVNQIDEPQKPKVSRVAVEFYEKYKDGMLALDEWFSDFYSKEAIEDFPRMEELADWLHGNDNETNRQRELALATLVTLGIDAVEIEQEKLYEVTVPGTSNYKNQKQYLVKQGKNWFFCGNDVNRFKYQFTKGQIEAAGFGWVFDCDGVKVEEVEG